MAATWDCSWFMKLLFASRSILQVSSVCTSTTHASSSPCLRNAHGLEVHMQRSWPSSANRPMLHDVIHTSASDSYFGGVFLNCGMAG